MDTSLSLSSGSRVCVAALALSISAAAACAPQAEEGSPDTGEATEARDTGGGARDLAPRDTAPAGDTLSPGPATDEVGDTSAAAGNGDTAARPDTSSAEAARPDTVEGVVRQVGNVPFVMTVVQGTDTVAVTGPYEEELSRAAGIRVRVVGRPVRGRYPEPTLEVSEYRLLSVSGARPRVGWLRKDDEGYYLEGEDEDAGTHRLGSVPSGLQGRLGAKVWVVTSGSGTVQHYGILRPPGSTNGGTG